MKDWTNSIIPSSLVLCGLLAATLFVYIAIMQHCAPVQHAPLFEVGVCIQANAIREAWEPEPILFKIIEIGEHSYKICTIHFCTDALEGRMSFLSLKFTEQYQFEQVSCGGL